LLAELRGVYTAFGFSPRTEEAPDHVSVEVAFLSFLKVKEAAARFDGHEALAREAARTAAAFARAHVARLAGPLADRLPGAGLPGMDVLQGAAESLRERVGLPETAAAPPPEEDPCDACPAAGGDFTGA
ncbi:MAG TPA: molecular chaperone TorD family protein, partial [Vicinamibacteria bacterium]|nr:molecular chaperone TorD family protein [Vicinamibacteria bacterium]